MTVALSVTINHDAVSEGETRRSEATQIAYLLGHIAQQCQSGAAVSNATLKDRNGRTVGSWTYSPAAAS